VLFIGNSLTSFHDLPTLVEQVSAADAPLSCESVTADDHSLEDHWTRGAAARAIRTGGWTVVVLQQGPSALPESQRLLREYTKRFDGIIKEAGAKTALYMVWPSRTRSADFDAVSAAYTAAARDVNGLLLPVGEAWRAAWRRDPNLRLYSPDGLHPSPLAAYLAALVIAEQLTGRPPARWSGAPEAGKRPSILPSPAEEQILRDAAAEANKAATPGTLAPSGTLP
jgi:hypothetical protein